MADKKISELTEASSVAAADYLAIVQGGVTKKVPLSALLAPTNANLQVASGYGLKFPASNAGAADANTLDDYEEGSWTPGIAFGNGSAGVTYGGSNGGFYTKIGNIVIVTGWLVLTSKGTDIGSAKITGLPFVVLNSPRSFSVADFRMYHVSFAATPQGYTEANSTDIILEELTEAGDLTNLTNADFQNDSHIMIKAIYRCA